MKTPSIPPILSSNGKRIGPTIAAPPNTTAYSDIALASWPLSTIEATIADLAGMSNANITPVAVAIAMSIHSFIAPAAMNAAVMKPDAANSRRVSCNTRNRFSRSARTPPHNVNTKIGT